MKKVIVTSFKYFVIALLFYILFRTLTPIQPSLLTRTFLYILTIFEVFYWRKEPCLSALVKVILIVGICLTNVVILIGSYGPTRDLLLYLLFGAVSILYSKNKGLLPHSSD